MIKLIIRPSGGKHSRYHPEEQIISLYNKPKCQNVLRPVPSALQAPYFACAEIWLIAMFLAYQRASRPYKRLVFDDFTFFIFYIFWHFLFWGSAAWGEAFKSAAPLAGAGACRTSGADSCQFLSDSLQFRGFHPVPPTPPKSCAVFSRWPPHVRTFVIFGGFLPTSKIIKKTPSSKHLQKVF